MENIENKLLEYGQKRDITKLQSLVSNTDEKDLLELVLTRLDSYKFTNIWKYLLEAFTDSQVDHEKRIKVILVVLKELQKRDSSTSSISLMHRTCMDLCMELSKFRNKHLVDLCTFCLQCIQAPNQNANVNYVWKDLLPDLLHLLMQKDNVEYNDMEYTGQEFKTDFINTLCMSNWSPNIIINMAIMFNDMTLSKEEHLKVANKLASYMEKLLPQEIPPFVYQLLSLCRDQNSKAIFIRLQSYFGLRIYSNPNFSVNNSESPNFDLIESGEDHDALAAESTVLFHIHSAASLGHSCIKEYLNSLKNTTKSPEFLLHPFQLLILLTISNIQHYEELVFDIIRPAIVRCYVEEQKRQSSCWFRETLNTTCKPENVFAQLIGISLQDKEEHVLQALVNFSFALLSVGSALGRDIIAEKQWNLGTMILLKIIKRNRHIAPIILKTFSNHIVTRQSATQYIECLYILTKSLPLLMVENRAIISDMIESLMQMPGSVANQLLDALIPLTKVLPDIRDQLILVLRKALYTKSIETRQMAVNGFIKLITNLKLNNMAVLSQSEGSMSSFSSGHSLYTQISHSRTTQAVGTSRFSNEAICFEILGILRSCFRQQAEVRATLYQGLYEAVCMNSELAIPILDTFWFHFSEFYITDEDSVTPLRFNKVALLRDTEIVSQEPLGKFVFAISMILTKTAHSEEESDHETILKYSKLFDSLCDRMSNLELAHLELDDGTDLIDILPESQHKMQILKEVLNVYEALIGYKIASWQKDSDNQGRIINSLFQGYQRFLNFGKTSSKPKKAKKPDKASQEPKTQDKIQKTQNRTKDTTLNTTKKSDSSNKGGSKSLFNPPESLLNFEVVQKALQTLLEPSVSWANSAEANTIKTRTDIHKHFIQAALTLSCKLKNVKFIDSHAAKMSYDNITSIAVILYNRVVKKFTEYAEFDCLSAVLALECFHAVLVVVNGHFKSNLSNFFSKIVSAENETSLVDNLRPIVEHLEKLFETNEDELSTDAEIKKVPSMLINILNVLMSIVPTKSNVISVQFYDWLKLYATEQTVSSKVASGFTNLLLESHIKYKVGLTVFKQVAVSLKSALQDEDETQIEEETLKIVHKGTFNFIILSICSNLKTILEDIDTVIARLKSDYYILSYPGDDNTDKKKEDLKLKEKAVSCQICLVGSVLTDLATIGISPGNLSDAIFKSIIQFYTSSSSLTKYFMGRSSKTNLAYQAARFEKVVKLAGKELTNLVYQLISHIEESQVNNQAKDNEKKTDPNIMKSKVLRETRIIPKVIYEIEQFNKCIIQLSKKTKSDLSKYVPTGVVRDFRIKKLKEVLEENHEMTVATQATTQDGDQSRANITMHEESNEENQDTSPPPSKRSKK